MHKLDDFIGQSALKDMIRPKIELARASGKALPQILLCGEKELGKMTFAAAVAEELEVLSTRFLRHTRTISDTFRGTERQ
jgi:Holliday junction resolvasome RuvABC ATP-dependent DNA helicase subunit